MFTIAKFFSVELGHTLLIGFDSVGLVFLTCVYLQFKLDTSHWLFGAFVFEGDLEIFGFLVFELDLRGLHDGFCLFDLKSSCCEDTWNLDVSFITRITARNAECLINCYLVFARIQFGFSQQAYQMV